MFSFLPAPLGLVNVMLAVNFNYADPKCLEDSQGAYQEIRVSMCGPQNNHIISVCRSPAQQLRTDSVTDDMVVGGRRGRQ